MIRSRQRIGGGQHLRSLLLSATVAGWLSILARVGGVALVIPIAFRTLAPTDTVLWLFFTNAINLQAILDFGHNTTFARFIAYARAGRAAAGAGENALVRSSPGIDVILHVIGPAYLRMTIAMMAFAVPLLSYLAEAPIRASTRPEVHWIVWLCACLSLAVQTYGGRFIAVLQGFERVAVQRWIEAGMGVFTNLFAGAMLWFNQQMAAAALSTALVGILGTLVYGYAARRAMMRALPVDGVPSTRNEVQGARQLIWQASWRSGIGVLCSTGLIQLLGMMVSNIASAVEAAGFMFAMRIALVISALSQSPFYNYLPTFARKYREHNLPEIRAEARIRMLSATLIVSISFIVIGVMGPWALSRLGAHVTFVHPIVWIAMGFAFLAERVGAMHMQLYTLGGHVIWHWVNGMTGLAMLTGTYMLYPRLGVIAIPLSMCAAYVAIYCVISIRRSYQLLSLSFSRFDLIASMPAVLLLCAAEVFFL